MELGGLSYYQVLAMPVNRLDEYLNWKIKYDQEKEKAKANSLESIKI